MLSLYKVVKAHATKYAVIWVNRPFNKDFYTSKHIILHNGGYGHLLLFCVTHQNAVCTSLRSNKLVNELTSSYIIPQLVL